MQNTASLRADQFDSLPRQLPGTVDLDRVARRNPGYLAACRGLSGGGSARRLSFTLADRTGVQAAEIAAAHGPASDPHRAGVAKLAHLASHHGFVVRRSQPGIPGLFPLRRCLTLPTSLRSGACGTLPGACCCLLSSAASPSMICCTPDPMSTAGSPTPGENEDHMSVTPSGGKLTPMGAKPAGGFQACTGGGRGRALTLTPRPRPTSRSPVR